jgi:peptide deformylase
MAVREILVYPDPILKQVSEPVGEVDESAVEVIQDLVDTMVDAGHSVGVAAPQIGVLRRVIVVDVSKSKLGKDNNHGLLEMVNPEIIESSGNKVMREGCMSVPKKYGPVKRYKRVKVRGTNLEGQKIEIKAEGFLARVLQHEIDHMNGKLFLSHVPESELMTLGPDGKLKK